MIINIPGKIRFHPPLSGPLIVMAISVKNTSLVLLIFVLPPMICFLAAGGLEARAWEFHAHRNPLVIFKPGGPPRPPSRWVSLFTVHPREKGDLNMGEI